MANLNPIITLQRHAIGGRGSRIFDDNALKLKCGWKWEEEAKKICGVIYG
jgi:hypothetical protein